MNKLVPLFEKHQKKVIFSSTSEVYGEGPFSEDNNLSIGPPSHLRWGYACAKLMTEFMIKASTFPSVIIRFFNVVGPGQSAEYGMVLPRFIEAAKTGSNLIVYGDGKQVRSFCHIKDAVKAILLLREEEGIFNIGNSTPTSIGELANAVLRLIGTTSVIQYVPYERDFSNQHGDIYNRIPNISKIRDLGYNTEYDLNNIIEDMI
jgi:UDP-glucose 4-epimerase